MPFAISAELNTLSPEQRTVVEARIALVHAAQRQQGMEPRDDSQLTYRYALGELPDDVPSSIATELVVVEKICTHTEYCVLLEHVMRVVATRLKGTHRALPWRDVWDIVRFYVPSMLKMYAFRQMQARGEDTTIF